MGKITMSFLSYGLEAKKMKFVRGAFLSIVFLMSGAVEAETQHLISKPANIEGSGRNKIERQAFLVTSGLSFYLLNQSPSDDVVASEEVLHVGFPNRAMVKKGDLISAHAMMTRYEAEAFCKAHGLRLPIAQEFKSSSNELMSAIKNEPTLRREANPNYPQVFWTASQVSTQRIKRTWPVVASFADTFSASPNHGGYTQKHHVLCIGP